MFGLISPVAGSGSENRSTGPKVREMPEWKEFMERGAFNQTFMSGKEYADWVSKNEQLHVNLMKEAGFLAKK